MPATPPGGVEVAVVADLRDRGLLDSTVGAQALALARRIDAGTDALAGVAAASRQLEALRVGWQGVTTDPDPVEVLIARRAARRQASQENRGHA